MSERAIGGISTEGSARSSLGTYREPGTTLSAASDDVITSSRSGLRPAHRGYVAVMAHDPNRTQPGDVSPAQSPAQGEQPLVRTGPLTTEAAHELVLHLERLGIDGDRIFVSVNPAPTQSPMAALSRADDTAIKRPAYRVVAGSLLGAVLGLAAADVAVIAWSVQPAPTFLAAGLGGAIVVGLIALYAGMVATPEAYDLDVGGRSSVEIQVEGLHEGTVAHVKALVAEAA
ncbi:MAG: hypothetical protein R2761_23825 [Acidimicrobiales bacterium]